MNRIHSLIHSSLFVLRSSESATSLKVVDTRVLAGLVAPNRREELQFLVWEEDVFFQTLVRGSGWTPTADPRERIGDVVLSWQSAAKASEGSAIGCGPSIASGAYSGPEADSGTSRYVEHFGQCPDSE